MVVMDNFKGQVIHVCLLPPNTADLLQPMDICVNKPAKAFLQKQFEGWYSVITQDYYIFEFGSQNKKQMVEPYLYIYR